ncbi:hypothetical protein MRX96_001849 [Rhipicephalus microplus]
MNTDKEIQPSKITSGVSQRNAREQGGNQYRLDFLYTMKTSLYALIEGFAWIGGRALNSPVLSGALLV